MQLYISNKCRVQHLTEYQNFSPLLSRNLDTIFIHEHKRNRFTRERNHKQRLFFRGSTHKSRKRKYSIWVLVVVEREDPLSLSSEKKFHVEVNIESRRTSALVVNVFYKYYMIFAYNTARMKNARRPNTSLRAYEIRSMV